MSFPDTGMMVIFALIFYGGYIFGSPLKKDKERLADLDHCEKAIRDREAALLQGEEEVKKRDEEAMASRLMFEEAKRRAEAFEAKAQRRVAKAEKERHGTVERFRRKEKCLIARIKELEDARDVLNPHEGNHDKEDQPVNNSERR